ncbi:MAG: hypothetical protein R3F04_15300 [Lysobacteraceae bacterium]
MINLEHIFNIESQEGTALGTAWIFLNKKERVFYGALQIIGLDRLRGVKARAVWFSSGRLAIYSVNNNFEADHLIRSRRLRSLEIGSWRSKLL